MENSTIYRLGMEDYEYVLNENFSKEEIEYINKHFTKEEVQSILEHKLDIPWMDYIGDVINYRLLKDYNKEKEV